MQAITTIGLDIAKSVFQVRGDRHARTWEKPSDHVLAWIDLAIEAKTKGVD